MLRYSLIYIFVLLPYFITEVLAQDSISTGIVQTDSTTETKVNEEIIDNDKAQMLSIGLAFDYLKLHTLLLDESEKWEGAINFRILDKVSIIGEYGIAELTPQEAYKNAEYTSEGNYYRIGLDYHFTVIPNNYLFLGLRYAQSSFNERIIYEIGNPIFENEINELNRSNLNATWYEFVISSEKKIRTIRKKEIPDLLSIGFKFRLKALQEYDDFDTYEVKNIPGYGRTNIRLNPELNLYVKFRIPIF